MLTLGREHMVINTLEEGGFRADIHRDDSTDPISFRYVITRKGDTAILFWGVEGTEELALVEARYALSNYAARV